MGQIFYFEMSAKVSEFVGSDLGPGFSCYNERVKVLKVGEGELVIFAAAFYDGHIEHVSVVGYKRDSRGLINKRYYHCFPDFWKVGFVADVFIRNVMDVAGPFGNKIHFGRMNKGID